MGVERGTWASVAVAAAIDVIAVLLFALVGRVSHDEGALGVLGTAWPFLGGLAVGWGAMRVWRHPRRIVWTGIGVWLVTVGGGMVLRQLTGQGTPLAFILVATAALGILLIGWRALSLLVARRRSSP